MKQIIILCALVSVTVAAVIPEDAQAQIVKYENSNDGAGNYKFSFQTSNGIYREEDGHLEDVGTENEHLVVKGFYTYTDSEGKFVQVDYTADENGYQVGPPQPVIEIVPESLPASVTATLLGK